MVLRLRIAPELWRKVSARQPNFNEIVERFLTEGQCWLFEEPMLILDGRTRAASGSVRRVLVAGGFQFRLEKPSESLGQWDFDIVRLMPETEKDFPGVQIKDQILVFKPAGVFVGEVAVLVKTRIYRRLPDFDKAPISLAWKKLARGRIIHRIYWNQDVIFHLTCRIQEASSAEAVSDMTDALERVAAGLVITDKYELRRIREMVAKFGEPVTKGETDD